MNINNNQISNETLFITDGQEIPKNMKFDNPESNNNTNTNRYYTNGSFNIIKFDSNEEKKVETMELATQYDSQEELNITKKDIEKEKEIKKITINHQNNLFMKKTLKNYKNLSHYDKSKNFLL